MGDSQNMVLDAIKKAVSDNLTYLSQCTLQEAIEIVDKVNGDVYYLSMYTSLRSKGHRHAQALEFLVYDFNHDKIENHLLACLSEECGEVVQLVGKSQRFGSMDYHPETGEQNFPAIQREMHDVLATYQLLCKHMGEPCKFDPDKLEAKRLKVIKLMKEYGVIK